MVESCTVTGGLLDALLAIAADREPDSVSTLLLVSRAGDLETDRPDAVAEEPLPEDESTPAGSSEGKTGGSAEAGTARATNGRTAGSAKSGAVAAPDGSIDVTVDDLDPDEPVFTDLYLPSAGRSIDAVFGMDVSVPHGQAQGRFVSHPLGELSVSTTDDLHEVVLVAVPPWGRDDVAAFDRSGRRLELRIVAAAPPAEPFDG